MCCAPIMRPLPTTLAVHSAPRLLGPVLPPQLPATAAGVLPPSELCTAGLPVLAHKGEKFASMRKQAAQALWVLRTFRRRTMQPAVLTST